jgi:hypothetical protein
MLIPATYSPFFPPECLIYLLILFALGILVAILLNKRD